jgi:hypothetical protein
MSYRRKGGTCRCPICGRKDAGNNHVRKGYIMAGIGRDECGFDWNRLSKKATRKLRRTREKREWRNGNA